MRFGFAFEDHVVVHGALRHHDKGGMLPTSKHTESVHDSMCHTRGIAILYCCMSTIMHTVHNYMLAMLCNVLLSFSSNNGSFIA